MSSFVPLVRRKESRRDTYIDKEDPDVGENWINVEGWSTTSDGINQQKAIALHRVDRESLGFGKQKVFPEGHSLIF